MGQNYCQTKGYICETHASKRLYIISAQLQPWFCHAVELRCHGQSKTNMSVYATKICTTTTVLLLLLYYYCYCYYYYYYYFYYYYYYYSYSYSYSYYYIHVDTTKA